MRPFRHSQIFYLHFVYACAIILVFPFHFYLLRLWLTSAEFAVFSWQSSIRWCPKAIFLLFGVKLQGMQIDGFPINRQVLGKWKNSYCWHKPAFTSTRVCIGKKSINLFVFFEGVESELRGLERSVLLCLHRKML